MKKIINKPQDIVAETIAGFVKANKRLISKAKASNYLYYNQIKDNKVRIMIANGSGHEPACIGFIGENMLDANIYGGLFAAPGPKGILDAITHLDQSNGTILLISNHAGDVLNGKMALDLAREDGYQVASVLLYDDIASAPLSDMKNRRGMAGTLFAYKLIGSYSSTNKSFEEVLAFAHDVATRIRTLAMATIPGTSPITQAKMFELADDEVEIGLGVHGEAAAYTSKMNTSFELSKIMVRDLVKDLNLNEIDEIAVLVNGMGQTTYMEKCIFYNDVATHLQAQGIKVYKSIIGDFITTQEMGGISLSFCLLNEELKQYLDMPSDAVATSGLF
ncbi:MAG: dihydroxyacetone kinase subunit DhaK [Bacilli bacterium]